MNFADIGVILGFMLCAGIIISMIVRMRYPINDVNESHAEVVKANRFMDTHYREAGYYTTKERYSITFLMNNKKKSYFCSEKLYYSVKSGDKVLIRYDRNKVTYLEIVQQCVS